jgi:sentrin-specific protease 1
MEAEGDRNAGRVDQGVDVDTKPGGDGGKGVGSTVKDAVVPIYGTLVVEEKDIDAVRVMSLNMNGIGRWNENNIKLSRLKNVLRSYAVDVCGLQETNYNFRSLKSSQTLSSLLRHGDDRIQSVVSHNTRETENIGAFQPGGVATLLRDELTGFIKDRGKDDEGLGLFCYYSVEGNDGHITYFMSAYAPCKAPGIRTYYQHLQRFIQENRLATNPIDLFRDRVSSRIKRWRSQGHRVVLMMDSNENVTDGVLSRRLAGEGIRMREAVHKLTEGRGPPTHFRGSEKSNGAIDGIWVSDDLEVVGASYLPFDHEIGDHRPVMVDILSRSILGVPKKTIVRPKARKLSSRVPRIRNNYLSVVREKFKMHQVDKKLRSLEERASFPPTQDVEEGMEKLDNLVEEIMLQAEGQCRIIYPAHYEFSPAVKGWLDKCHALQWLLRYHQGKKVNGGNMRRFAMRNGIKHPMRLSVTDLVEMYHNCKEQARHYMAQSPWLRKTFLNDKMNVAIDQGNSDEANRIKGMLKAEAQRKTWQDIQRVTKPRGMLSVTRVEVERQDGVVTEYVNKEEIEKAVMEELTSRFGRAGSAPICQGVLYDLLGTYADTDAAVQILEGTFTPPTDADGPTLIILEEIARIWQLMGDGEVNIVITQEDYQYYWRKVKESTSSSLSGLHFGHYKAIGWDDELSNILARKLSLISATGSAPQRWARGLSVMLEKIAGVALLTKLRAILLLEADFNQHNKLIFQHRMLALARENGLIPEEIFSEKGKTAEDAILQQVLMYDIARITKRPLLVAQVDASQCYDRVAHAMAALTLRAYKVHNSSVLGMLRPLHCMEFYLRTGFGQSTSFCGGAAEGKHGLAQGNGAAPATWQQISSLMIHAQHRQGHGVKICTPISKRGVNQVGIVYVDDTNLCEGLEEKDDIDAVVAKGQGATNSWGNNLIAVGGALNGDKCAVAIHDMVPDGKGSWVYSDQRKTTSPADEEDDELEELEDWSFSVPQADSEAAQIKRLRSDQAVENLGLFVRPDGSPEKQFEVMREKITTWSGQIKNGVIPTRSVWMSYTHQLWSGLRYGLGACSASMTALSKGLGSSDYYLLSNLGVVRSITREWRYLPASFGGMELFDLTTEVTAATLNSFLQHFGTNTLIGTTLQAALEYLQLELGVEDCPLSYDFNTWGHLATDTWVKALWEKVDLLDITLLLEYEGIPKPREHDCSIMSEMVKLGFKGKELKRINRARIAQEALFISDIATARGTNLEIYLEDWWEDSFERDMGEHRSVLQFSREDPTDEDWKTWKKALRHIASGPNLYLNQPLGKWIAPSTRKWRQFYHPETNTGELHYDDKILRFENDPDDRAYILSLSGEAEAALTDTIPVTFVDVVDGKLKLKSRGPKLAEPPLQEHLSFIEALRSKGGEWMWEGLVLDEDPDWIIDALERGSLYCATDGSHNKKLAPLISGAAWVLFCSHSRKVMRGEFAEFSVAANSYRAEQLGMLALHLLLLTAEEYYQQSLTDANIFCDNKGTIQTFSKEHRRIPAGAKNNDILRVLRRIQTTSKLAHKLQHVKAHQDDNVPFRLLSLDAKLNFECDLRAKHAVQQAIADDASFRTTIYSLPLEQASVFFDGSKQTSDIAKELRYQIGRRNARQFYQDEKIMDNSTFDSIAWADLRSLLEKRPKMYQLWYGKQCSGFCGTGQMISRWDPDASDSCPNCGRFETADHLTRCESRIRRDLMKESIRDLDDWMSWHCTHPDLRLWIPRYFGGQGRRLFVDLVHPEGRKMSQNMRIVGNKIDRIGWRHFTEGKLPTAFRDMQRQHLLSHHKYLTIDVWMKGFIDQLLTLTHTQWLCRNLTKHHKTMGTKALATREEIQKEVEEQLRMGFSDLPSYARCLLEISPDNLFGLRTADQQYWLNAVRAARTAAESALQISEGKTNSWNDILKMPEFKTRIQELPQLPTNPERPAADRTNPRESSTKRRKVSRRQPARTNSSQSAGVDGDRIQLLRRNNVSENSKVPINALLSQPLASESSTATDPDLSFKRSAIGVQFESLKTLNPGLWLKSDVINSFAMNIIRPLVRNRRVHFFSTYFFSRLLDTGPHGTQTPSYKFDEVKRWGDRLSNGILGVKELIIPINHRNVHWLCLKVSMANKSIMLWDSSGVKESNQLYLNTMLRYLKDKFGATSPQEDADDWIAQWTTLDDSANCPRQYNGYDCGVFTIVNMTLQAQNIPLSNTLYEEQDFQNLDTRRRIAYLLWEASSNRPQPTSTNRPQLDRALPSKRPSSSTTKAGSSSTKERQKRRRQNNRRVAVGSNRLRGKVTYDDPGPSDQLTTLLNRKRNAASVAIEESALPAMTQRHAPKKRRRKKASQDC